MRRFAAALLVPLAACAVLAGCGSSGSPAADANAAVKVSGTFDKTPSVTIPTQKASSKLVISTPDQGHRSALKTGNAALANVAVYKWSGTSHSLVDSHVRHRAADDPGADGPAGPDHGAEGRADRQPGRRRAAAQVRLRHGGQTQLQISGTDTLVWVIDLLQQYSSTQSATGSQVSTRRRQAADRDRQTGQAPVITVPKNSPPAKLSVTTLIKGSGPKLANGDTVVAQYVGSIWRTGKVFSSSWPSAQSPQACRSASSSAARSWRAGTRAWRASPSAAG